MAASDRLVGIRSKIDRAKYHIRDFVGKLESFRTSHGDAIVREVDPKTGDHVYRIGLLSEPPVEFSLIAGEAVHQLRSSLDHLAWQLVESNNGTPTEKTGFPIRETLAKYESLDGRIIEGMSGGAIKVIESVQPYKSGYGDLWAINELDNFDKHRLLFVVFSTAHSPKVVWSDGANVLMVGYPGGMAFEEGAEITRITGGGIAPHVKEKADATIEIAFRKPQIIQGKSVVKLLTDLSGLVESIVDLFVPFL